MACPLESFMTWPTKKAATVFLPPRYCSTCLGLAAMTSSIIFFDRGGVADLLRFFALVDDAEVFSGLEGSVEELLELFAGELAVFGEVGGLGHALHGDGRLLEVQALGLQAAGELALDEIGDPAGVLRRAGSGLELVGEGAGGGEGGGVLLGDAVFGDHAGAAGLGQLGEAGGHFGLEGRR